MSAEPNSPVDVDGPFIEITDGPTHWRFDQAFLTSNWRCIWGDGCQGIHDERAPDLMDGCCSVGAELLDADESRLIGALGSALDPARFERWALARDEGVFSDVARAHTRVVDGVCIFHNGPDFAGGPGCALHLAAVDAGEDPLDWKPTVCWQLPIKIERSTAAAAADDDATTGSGSGHDVRTVRAWSRDDWGPGGATMAWCCSDPSEAPEAFTGDGRVIDSLGAELRALVGDAVYERLRGQVPDG